MWHVMLLPTWALLLLLLLRGMQGLRCSFIGELQEACACYCCCLAWRPRRRDWRKVWPFTGMLLHCEDINGAGVQLIPAAFVGSCCGVCNKQIRVMQQCSGRRWQQGCSCTG
jgi:hypothetical protein